MWREEEPGRAEVSVRTITSVTCARQVAAARKGDAAKSMGRGHSCVNAYLIVAKQFRAVVLEVLWS